MKGWNGIETDDHEDAATNQGYVDAICTCNDSRSAGPCIDCYESFESPETRECPTLFPRPPTRFRSLQDHSMFPMLRHICVRVSSHAVFASLAVSGWAASTIPLVQVSIHTCTNQDIS